MAEEKNVGNAEEPQAEGAGPSKMRDVAKKAASAGFLMPSVLVGAVVALVVAQYQPLVFDASAYPAAEQASASEMKPVAVTSERQSDQPPTGVSYDASDYGVDAKNLKDGTYTGSGQGYKSTITVEVTISGGKITAIDVVSQDDDEPYFSNAKTLISQVIAKQSTSVDTVSGATYSSKGILVAIKNALDKAAGGTGTETNDGGQAAVSSESTKQHTTLNPTEAPSDGYVDGVYTGSGEGYKSTITVAVSISGGKISQIDVVSQDDDAEYFSRAQGLIAQIVAKQSTAVDVVSGATFSSEGILSAVEDALSKAVRNKDTASAGDGDGGNGDAGNSGNGGDNGSGDNGNNGGDSTDDDADTGYLDGEYPVFVKCINEEDEEEFEPYYLAMTVTVKGGRATAISNLRGTETGAAGDPVLGAYDTANDLYLNWAANGRTIKGVQHAGVVAQLIDQHKDPSNIDVVSRATYSSRAIANAYAKAMELAKEAYDKAHAKAAGDGADAGSNDAVEDGTEAGSGDDAAAPSSDDAAAPSEGADSKDAADPSGDAAAAPDASKADQAPSSPATDEASELPATDAEGVIERG